MTSLYFKRSLIMLVLCFCSTQAISQAPVINGVTSISNTISKNNKFELTVNLTAGYTNPYDYDDIAVKCTFTSPTNKVVIVDGFYMQNYTMDGNGNLTASGTGVFKVRFTPREVGSWTYIVSCTNKQGTTKSESNFFNCISSDKPGFIVKGAGTYLLYDTQDKLFVPVGLNMGWQNSSVVTDYTNWLNKLSLNGGNFIRVWMSSWAFAIEWQNGNNGFQGLKKYKQQNAFYLDWLVDKCEEKNVYMMLCLNNHGQVSSNVNPEWNSNPYKASNGGPAANTWDFFTNTNAKELHKNRLRYIVARYGYSSHIQSWELFNEVDWTDQFDNHKADVTQWHSEMSNYLKSIDPNVHLVTTSYAHDNEGDATWKLANIDFTQTHFYNSSPNLENILASGARDYRIKYAKPSLNGEFGVNTDGVGLAALDPAGVHLHNAIWGSTYSTAMGSAMSWWWDNYINPQNLFYHFKGLSSVVAASHNGPYVYLVSPTGLTGGGTADLAISPSGDWGTAPSDNFAISAAGDITPAASQLSKYLYGSSYNTQYRKPPTFTVNYPVAGLFKVTTGGNMGTTPKVTIYVDGVIQLNNAAATNTTYSLNVAAGQHTIKVDNLGTDWIEISSYTFSNIGSPLSSYVLVSSDNSRACGWILNKKYNYQYLKDNNNVAPPAVSGVTVSVPNLQVTGKYNVQFYDCITGLPTTAVNNIENTNGKLVFDLPAVAWDIAFIITQSSILAATPINFYGKSAPEKNTIWLEMKNAESVKMVEVERSADGMKFYSIGNITAADNNYNGKHSFVDGDPFNGGNWYRLKIYEKSGAASYTAVVYLTHASNRKTSFFPNPVKDRIWINAVGLNAGKYSVVVTDLNGRKLQSGQIELGRSNEKVSMPFQPVNKGIYVLYLVNNLGAVISKQSVLK